MKKMSLTAISEEELAAHRAAWKLSSQTVAQELVDKIAAKWESMSLKARLDKVVFAVKAGPGRNSNWHDDVIVGLLAALPDGFEVVHLRIDDTGDMRWVWYFGQKGCVDFDEWSYMDREPDVEV